MSKGVGVTLGNVPLIDDLKFASISEDLMGRRSDSDGPWFNLFFLVIANIFLGILGGLASGGNKGNRNDPGAWRNALDDCDGGDESRDGHEH
jgi:hypothetical protein